MSRTVELMYIQDAVDWLKAKCKVSGVNLCVSLEIAESGIMTSTQISSKNGASQEFVNVQRLSECEGSIEKFLLDCSKRDGEPMKAIISQPTSDTLH